MLTPILLHIALLSCLVPLAAADPASAEAASLWARYLTDWTLWNHVRTVSSTLACALFIAAIAAR